MTSVTAAPRHHHRRPLQSAVLVALLLIPVFGSFYPWDISVGQLPALPSPPHIGSGADRAQSDRPAQKQKTSPVAEKTTGPTDAGSGKNTTTPGGAGATLSGLLRTVFIGGLMMLGLAGALVFGLLLLVGSRPSVPGPPGRPTPQPRPSRPAAPQQTHPPQVPPRSRPQRAKAEPDSLPRRREPKRPRYLEPALFVNDGAWKVIAASVQGTSHLKTDKPCQDASYSTILPGSLLIGAVADGAGSAPFSDEGAQIAVKRAVDTVADAVQLNVGSGASPHAPFTTDQWHEVLRAAMQVALGHVELGAALRGTKPRDFATTLLLFAGLRDGLVAAQIGDGAIVIRDCAGHLHAITTPQSGEYANTTTFLVSPGAFDTVQHRVWDRAYTGVAAFTDGLQRLALAMPSGDPHGPFFTPLFDFADRAHDSGKAIEEIDAFLRSSKVAERADDDLTLMVARKTS